MEFQLPLWPPIFLVSVALIGLAIIFLTEPKDEDQERPEAGE